MEEPDYGFLLKRLTNAIRNRNLEETRSCFKLVVDKVDAGQAAAHTNKYLNEIDKIWLEFALKQELSEKEVAIEALAKLDGQRRPKGGPINKDEVFQKEYLEKEVLAAMERQITIGRELKLLRDLKLWRFGYTSFKQYCREHLGTNNQWPYEAIKAFETYSNLQTEVKPHCLTTITALCEHKGLTPNDANTIWERCVAEHGERPRKDAVVETAKAYRAERSEECEIAYEPLEPGTIVRIVAPSKGAGFAPVGNWGKIYEPAFRDLPPHSMPGKVLLAVWNKVSWISRSKVEAYENFGVEPEYVEKIFRLSNSDDQFLSQRALAYFSLSTLDSEQKKFLDTKCECLPA